MMTHPGLDTLLAHADGELSIEDERDIALHAAGCAACSESLTELRGSAALFAGSLHVLDGAEPAEWSIAAPELLEAESAEPVIPLRRRAAAPATRHALRWAAGIALIAGAAASAAIIAERIGPAADQPVDAAPPVSVEPAVATIIATPRGGVLHVALSGAGAGSRLHVALGDVAEAAVAVEGGESPRFTAATGRVAVDLRGSTATVRVTVPSDLTEVLVMSDGVPLAIVRDGVLTPTVAGTSGVPLDAAVRVRME